MKSNRRSVLIGLGALTVGGGAVFGTGAFSSVEADRTVTLEVSNDSNALLQIEEHTSGSAIVETETDNGTEVLTLNETDLNENALTTFTEALTITNTGTQDVGFYIEDSGAASATELDIIENGGASIVGAGGSVDLSGGSGSVDLDIEIDLQDSKDVGNIGDTLTLVADVGEWEGGA